MQSLVFTQGLSRLRLLLFILFLISAASLRAESLQLTDMPQGMLGLHTKLLIEDGLPLTLGEAQIRLRKGLFRQSKQAAPSFGISSRPVWVHLEVFNPTQHILRFRLALGTTWIDFLDVYMLHDDQVAERWQVGDAYPGAAAVTPGTGFTFVMNFPPGRSALFVRAETVDPLVLPIELIPIEYVAENERWSNYGFGFLYGFLTALAAYNWMLYAGLRKRSHFYYALYLASFVFANLSYTGHGFAWWWPSQPFFQRYVTLVAMVLYGSCGLLFASRFLMLAKYAPRMLRAIRLFMLSGVGILALCVALDSHRGAAQLAFWFVLLSTLWTVLLGVFTLQHRRVAGRYFLVAVLFGFLGSITTTLTVWGWIPFSQLAYHGVDLGIILEATLLALALAQQVRDHQEARRQAEHTARHDVLTGLYNRRAFFEQAEILWSTAKRKGRPLCIAVLDIDHFKKINDRYGHAAGDSVLVDVARLLSQVCRTGDIVARWGGEEFVLLFPETDLEQSRILAERVRRIIEELSVSSKEGVVTLTASLGVVECNWQREDSLQDVIQEADKMLYQAKARGRNQIASVRMADVSSAQPIASQAS